MNWRIGIDTGGTFTDLVGINTEDGRRFFHKVHSTPHDPGEALSNGVLDLCSRHNVSTSELSMLIHGTTVATNAVLERKGARTAFITQVARTKGFGHRGNFLPRDMIFLVDSFLPDGAVLGSFLDFP